MAKQNRIVKLSREEREWLYRRGAQARMMGLPILANPYYHTDDLSRSIAWEQGWHLVRHQDGQAPGLIQREPDQ